jgi:hypothetical protein
MGSKYRLLELLKFAVKPVPEGNLVNLECGVFFGGFARYINLYFPNTRLYLADTYTNFDENQFEEDVNFNKNEEQITANLGFIERDKEYYQAYSYTYPNSLNCHYLKGLCPEVLKEIPEDEQFYFISLDMDLYTPTKETFKVVVERLHPDGLIFIHDFQYYGIWQSIDELRKEYPGFEFELLRDFNTVAVRRVK